MKDFCVFLLTIFMEESILIIVFDEKILLIRRSVYSIWSGTQEAEEDGLLNR